MDEIALALMLGIVQSMPDNAASSAAAAAASAQQAHDYADQVTAATVAETKSYLGIR